MISKTLKVLFALSLLGVLCISCNSVSKSHPENKVDYDSISVEKTYHLLDNPDNPNCDLHIKFVYPSSVKDISLQDIQQFFVTSYFGDAYEKLSPEDAVKKYTQDYLNSYKELEADYKEELKRSEDGAPVSSWFSYYELSSNEINFNQYGVISYTVNFENYTGGAHGSHAHNHFVLSAETGKQINEEDIFIENYEEALAEILVNQIAKENNAANPKELENMGFFSVEEIFPNNNFMIDNTGITYTFNEYEIAAYAVGAIEVHLPFEALQNILKEESPITKLVASQL